MAAPYDPVAERNQLLKDVDRKHIHLVEGAVFLNNAQGNQHAAVHRSKVPKPALFSGAEHERSPFSDFIVQVLRYHVYMGQNTSPAQTSSLLRPRWGCRGKDEREAD